MKTWMDKRITRILTFFLLLVLIAVGSLGAIVWNYGWSNSNWSYSQFTSFADTVECHDFVQDGINFVRQNIGYLDPEFYDDLGGYSGSAFSYRIVLDDGYIIVDTTTESSVPVESLSDVHNGVQYIVQGYVNLPVEKYGGCYAEYLFYNYGHPVFVHRWAITLGAYCLAFLLLVLLLRSLYRQGKTGRLSAILQIPLEVIPVLLLAVLLLSAELRSVFWRYETYAYSIQLAMMQYYWCVSLLSLAVISLCLFTAQFRAKVLYDRLLSVRLLRHIPLELWCLGFIVVNIVCVIGFFDTGHALFGFLLVITDVAAIVYFGSFCRQRRKIQQAVRELAEGNLSYKVNASHMCYFWKNIGLSLNNIGDGMASAVEAQIKSERMKTELITNVSHDLKTPLTSIINYVQLLKDDSLSPELKKEYLEVLERQSAKLKKLTEDVVDASKAASGALTVNSEKLDAGELFGQSVGEFEARMRAANLEPVLQLPEKPAYLAADSALLGRVLENLLTNIVKYAQPGTRVYFALFQTGDSVILSAKNISREPLNISADELMERFVRGDSSRHSEGRGLGLSIAKSLAELMGGRLDIFLDGDLFKAEIRFPQMLNIEENQ